MKETEESLKLKEVYRNLALMITSHHELLLVESNQQANFIAISPKAHKDDAAKLVGVHAETFHAMRIICSVVASKIGVRFHLAKVKGDWKTHQSTGHGGPVMRRDWPKDKIMELARSTCEAMFSCQFHITWDHKHWNESVLMIDVESNCSDVPDEVIGESLNRVFMVIGNANGHQVQVKLNQDDKGNLIEHKSEKTSRHLDRSLS